MFNICWFAPSDFSLLCSHTSQHFSSLPLTCILDCFQVIEGEVYNIDRATLRFLDDLERHPNFYVRHEIAVYMLTDENDLGIEKYKRKVWAYLLPGFKECLLDLPTYNTYNPDMIPAQRSPDNEGFPMDHDQQELCLHRMRRGVLKEP